MSKSVLTEVLTPNVVSFLPLFYIGWSDSVLSPSEINLIQSRIEAIDYLKPDEKAYLKKWTDPKHPPTPEVFKTWSTAIQNAAVELDDATKVSLIDLGLEIAKTGQQTNNISDNTRKALLDIESALEIDDTMGAHLLASKIFPELDKDQLTQSSDAHLVQELKSILDENYGEIKDRVRQLLTDPIFKLGHEPDKDIYRLNILNQVKALSKQGLSAYSFPKEYGGFEKKGDHIAIFEMLGYGDLSLAIKFGVQIGLFGGAVYLLGTKRHHRKYVEALHKSELLGCFAMTETGHGSDVKGLKTTATYDHATKEIVIHSPDYAAGKEYIGNAMHSTMAAVFAQLIVNGESHGVHCVLVPIRDNKANLMPGVKVVDCGYKMGLNGVDNGRIWFDQVRVPAENLLNRFGDVDTDGNYTSPIMNPSKRFFTMLGALVVGRICVGLLGINAAKKALAIAIKYALKRRQFSTGAADEEFLIMNYPTHQKRLIPKLSKVYAHYFALRDLAEQYAHNDDEAEIRRIENFAAGLKAKGTWLATDTIQECRESCGGKGYLTENQFTYLKADSDIFTTFEGDNTVLMQLVAKGILTEYKQSFHDNGYRAVVRYLMTKVKHEIYEINPITKRSTDFAHLTDPDFYYDAFKYRFRKTLIALSDRMRKYLSRGMNSFQAFLKVQNHMVDLADAYMDMHILKSFYKRINALESDDKSKAVMTKLYQVYALETIQDNKAWFLENDYFDGAKTKAIRRVATKLRADLVPNLSELVDAFAIPDELLAADIVMH